MSSNIELKISGRELESIYIYIYMESNWKRGNGDLVISFSFFIFLNLFLIRRNVCRGYSLVWPEPTLMFPRTPLTSCSPGFAHIKYCIPPSLSSFFFAFLSLCRPFFRPQQIFSFFFNLTYLLLLNVFKLLSILL